MIFKISSPKFNTDLNLVLFYGGFLKVFLYAILEWVLIGLLSFHVSSYAHLQQRCITKYLNSLRKKTHVVTSLLYHIHLISLLTSCLILYSNILYTKKRESLSLWLKFFREHIAHQLGPQPPKLQASLSHCRFVTKGVLGHKGNMEVLHLHLSFIGQIVSQVENLRLDRIR